MALTGVSSIDLGDRLAERTLELIDIASQSGAERDIVGHLLEVLGEGGAPAHDAGDTCVVAGAKKRAGHPFVLLAGHLDTVPAQENWPGRRIDGHVQGLGASDMKGGVAVMIELALAGFGSGEDSRCEQDVGYLFFGREELPSADGALTPLLARESGLREADLAVVLEPTANVAQAGCLGNLDATWTFHGRAGHSARPWLAENAIDRAVAGVRALHAVAPVRTTIEGLEFVQVASVTMLRAGVARNVIPGTAVANVNFRYAPDTSAAEAERAIRGLCEPYGELEILSNSHGACPPEDNALLHALVVATEAPAQAKQAWTPVAEFAAAGIEAINLGPGDPALAHRADERVAAAALVRSYGIFESFLCA